MKSNVSKVIERGDRLEDLQDKSGNVLCLSYSTALSHEKNVPQYIYKLKAQIVLHISAV